MSGWGDPNFQRWGGFEWGVVVSLDTVNVFADFVAQVVDKELSVDTDLLSQLTDTQTVDVDYLGQGEETVRCDVDMFVSRTASTALSGIYTRPILLAYLGLAGGIRVCSHALEAGGFGWSGKLLSSSEITQSLERVSDDLQVVIADADRAIVNTFAATPPENAEVTLWLLALDDPDEQLVQVFAGRVAQVDSVEVDGRIVLDVVRADAVLDQPIGRLLTTAIQPNAPDEALGQMIPLVWGTVEEHEGLVIDSNAVSQLDGAILETTTSLILRDASRFPTTGYAFVNEEIVYWGGKTGNELTNLIRGTFLTTAAPHPSGSVVIQRGTFAVQFCDHSVTSIEDVRFEDPNGNLAIPEPAPTIDTANARATWDETPRITVVSRSTEVLVHGYESTLFDNTVADALFAARESGSYTDLNYATIGSGQVLGLSRTNTPEDVGEIVRAGLVVAFDPDTAASSRVRVGTQVAGYLVPQNNLPAWALRRAERQFRATFDVVDPTHAHTPSNTLITVRASAAIANGFWIQPENALQDPGTVTFFADTNNDRIPLVMNGITFTLATGQSISRMRLGAYYAGAHAAGSGSASMILQLANQVGGSLAQAIVSATGPGTQVFSSWNTNSAQLNAQNWGATQFVARPNGPTNGVYAVRDMFAQFELAGSVDSRATAVTQRRSQVNFFDLTHLAQSDWNYFGTATKGGALRIDGVTGARINGAFWLVEVRPRAKTAIEVPRVFAKIRGQVPSGKTTDVLRQMITFSPPYGLGLSSSAIAQGPYARAAQSLASDGIRLDFAVRQQRSVLGLIEQVVDQSDLRGHWESGQHHLYRKPRPSALSSVFRDFTQDDVLKESLQRTREPLSDLRNSLDYAYRFAVRVNGYTRALAVSDATSISSFGTHAETVELDLVRDDTTATVVSARRLERAKNPHWVVTWDMPLVALELIRGDLVGLTHPLISFAKAEIVGLAFYASNAITVRVTAVVWEE